MAIRRVPIVTHVASRPMARVPAHRGGAVLREVLVTEDEHRAARRGPAGAGGVRAVDQHDAQDRGQAGLREPVLFYKHFLESTVLTHPELFAQLTAWGETAAGLGLTLGLLTGWRRWSDWSWSRTTGWPRSGCRPGQQGFHLVLFALMLAFFRGRAGRVWGLDARLAAARPDSPLRERPLS